ncbi:hypothetical protein D3C86_1674260 [compost metagenome]
MLGKCRLELIETPEIVAQAQLGLHPGQRLMLRPVKHLRRQFVEAHQLLAEHRHQHQQQNRQDQAEQGEDHDHAPGARKLPALEPIDQRIAQVSQQHADQERRENRLQQIQQPAEQEQPSYP